MPKKKEKKKKLTGTKFGQGKCAWKHKRGLWAAVKSITSNRARVCLLLGRNAQPSERAKLNERFRSAQG